MLLFAVCVQRFIKGIRGFCRLSPWFFGFVLFRLHESLCRYMRTPSLFLNTPARVLPAGFFGGLFDIFQA
jgi:hypothetical protein